MSAGFPETWAHSGLLTEVTPVGRSPRARLATASLGGRRVLLAELESGCATDAVAVAALAEARGSAALVLAPEQLVGPVAWPALRGPHVLVGPAPTVATRAALETSGLLLVSVGGCAIPLLTAEDVPTAIDLGTLLLGYLPTPGGSPPVYAPLDPADAEAGALGPARHRNAIAVLHALADDALRVLPGEDDALVLALTRIRGNTVAVIAPQRLGGEVLGEEALARLTTLVRLAARADVPVLVLGSPQDSGCGAAIGAVLLRELATAVGELRRPLLMVADDTPASDVLAVLGAAPVAVELDPTRGLRSAVAAWLT